MEVVIAGGHGQIALRLTRLLAARGDAVRSLIRNPDHAADVRAARGEPVLCDLEALDARAVAEAVGQADAVVFAAGAGPGSGAARKATLDHEGAVKLAEAAVANAIGRYVMVSAMGADPAAAGDDVFSAYLRAKGRADEAVRASGLDWTIVRPGRLTDEPGTGRVRIAVRTGRGDVPRDDVAAVLAAVLHEPATAGRAFDLVTGEDLVDEAVAAIA
jgi:uncharacterized protein YbjT (DUF2867 family)